ncbi:MAG: hypothetical protein JWR38_896 [Mucilaginibacter sp.]|nr:hypothetical protein [Mucilaginibacter sp.]
MFVLRKYSLENRLELATLNIIITTEQNSVVK